MDKKIEPELKEEQTEIWQQLKEDGAEKKKQVVERTNHKK